MEGKVGNFLRIELRGPSPTGIAAMTNAVADRFVEVAAELKREKLIGLTKILEAQLEQARQSLASAEGQLRNFRMRNAPELARSSAGVARDPAAGAMFELQGNREQLRRDRETIERLLAEAGDGPMSVEGLGMIPSVGRSAEFKQALDELTNKQTELRALRYRYTEEHLPVQRLAAEVQTLERQTIPALARSLVTQLGSRDTELRRQIDSAGGSLRNLPAVALEDGRLQRNVTIAEAVFSGIQQRAQEARLAEVSTLPEVRVLDRAAQPQAPVYSARALVVLLAFFTSFAAGVIGAVLLDQVDPRLRYPEEVTRRMGLPILGAVPHAGTGAAAHAVASVVERSSKLISAVRRSRLGQKALPAVASGPPAGADGGNGAGDTVQTGGGRPPMSVFGRLAAAVRSTRLGETIAQAVPSLNPNQATEAVNQAVESLRGIRLNLVHAYGTAGPMVVTVTSPGRGDGKSFVSSNLALAFADAGHRTLLMDGDTRRGALHRVLEVNRTPGLIDLLSGQAVKADVIQETAYPRLSFIGCGTRVSHGPELLGSPTMQRVMAEVRAAYDVVIVDSPPLAAGIDSLILGTLSGGMLLVLRAGVTDRQLAEAKLDALDRLPIRMLGAVINDVPAQGAYRYYSYYLSGYEIDEEKEKAGAAES
jgi:capsular exopolysaccharide synthesis family protein